MNNETIPTIGKIFQKYKPIRYYFEISQNHFFVDKVDENCNKGS